MITLKVMTFNIRGAREGEGINAWENRAGLNVRVIRESNPDLIGFQELQEANLMTYRDQLSEYQIYLGPATNRPERIFYNAIFWKPEKLTPLEWGGFYLSRMPDTWSLDWDSGRVRGVSWVHFLINSENRQFIHLNTHFDHLGTLARVQSAHMTIEWIEQKAFKGYNTVLTGDFNSLPVLSSPGENCAATPYPVLIENGFVDCFLATNGQADYPAHTFHGFLGDMFANKSKLSNEAYLWMNGDLKQYGGPDLHTGAAQAVDRFSEYRLDWILMRCGADPARPKQCTIIRDCQPPLYPSDHYPVMADIEFGRAF
jgi:endonuclease/exonuclease/phosphatase family metal-dependent hydrolase